MINVTIVRHGETDWNAEGRLQGKIDIELNDTGRQQAQECRQALSMVPYDVIITSSLKRAKMTASLIHHDKKAEFVEMDEFTERFFGDGEGLTFEQREHQFPNTTAYPNQELLTDFNKRIMDGLDHIVKHYDHKEIILVTHGAVLNEMFYTLSNGQLKKGEMGLFNGSISNIRYENGKWSIISYNNVDHLSEYSEIGKI